MYDKIRKALETALVGISGIPAIAHENVSYNPQTDTPFIRVRFLPSDRRPAVMGINSGTGKPYQQRYQGIFQLVLFYPENSGAGATETIVNSILDAFEASTDLTYDGVNVTIRQTEKMRAYNESPWYKTPVNIHWYCYTT